MKIKEKIIEIFGISRNLVTITTITIIQVHAIIGLIRRCTMEIDQFISTIDIKETSLKETIAIFANIKGDSGITLIEIIHVQTAYIDKMRKELL